MIDDKGGILLMQAGRMSVQARPGGLRLAALAAALLLASLTLAGPTGVAAVTPAERDAIAFRIQYGLNADPASVAAAEANPKLSRSYGVALTADEEANLRSRESVTAALEPLTLALEQNESFAGLYIDQAAGGVIDIATTGDKEAIADAVARFGPSGARVRVRQVTYSTRELESLQAKVASDFETWRAKGVAVATAGIDVQANRVRITVENLTNSAQAEIEASYGPAVAVTVGEAVRTGACNSRTDCGSPLKGGLSITGGGFVCTSGFIGRSTTNPPLQLYVLTAGHCVHDSGLSATWYHHGVAIGTGAYDGYYSGTLADIGLIRATESGAKNLVYASSNLDIRNIDGKLTNAQQPVGATICRSGQSSGWKCGTISQTMVDAYVGGVLVRDMWITGYSSAGGDSGGSMMNNGTKAAGILSGITSTQTFYSTMDYVQFQVAVQPCYNASCS